MTADEVSLPSPDELMKFALDSIAEAARAEDWGLVVNILAAFHGDDDFREMCAAALLNAFYFGATYGREHTLAAMAQFQEAPEAVQ
jgi:hypothetical protein